MFDCVAKYDICEQRGLQQQQKRYLGPSLENYPAIDVAVFGPLAICTNGAGGRKLFGFEQCISTGG